MTAAAAIQDIQPGLQSPVYDAQHIFRQVMDAMARPGRIVNVDSDVMPPVSGFDGLCAIALTLLDFETPVFLPQDESGDALAVWLGFHCGCPVTKDPQEAASALLRSGDLATLSAFNSGNPKYPDVSTTLLLACPALDGGKRVTLTGPGIKDKGQIAPAGLNDGFWKEVQADRLRFQLGVDIILGADDTIIGLPRTTRIEEES